MGKNKLRRFEENKSFSHLLQPSVDYPFRDDAIKGKWNNEFFSTAQPIVLELGCGRGEYTVNLARFSPKNNYIGVDIKGARIWRGAKTVHEESLKNVGFLRIQIERIENFFAEKEVSEIWITFPDPQPQLSRERKRLTSPRFLARYKNILVPGGKVHLKTDNKELYEYSLEVARELNYPLEEFTDDLYAVQGTDEVRAIKTTYEQIFLKQGMKICYLRFRIP